MSVERDWHTTSLSLVTETITSGSRGWAKYYAETGSLFLRMTNLPREGTRLLTDDSVYVDIPDGLAEAERTRVRTGDVLISITAELGKIGLVNGVQDAYVNQHVALLRPRLEIVDPSFLAYYLATSHVRARILRRNDAGAKAGLNLKTLGALPLELPPLHEQRRIAEILATWDEAIEKTERLLAIKRQRVLGLIQEVTCAAKAERATVGHLGDYCTISKGSGLSKEAVGPEGAHPCVLYGELYTVYGEVVENVVSRTNTRTSVVSSGDEVLIPASTTTTGEDLANATALREPGVLLGGDINILRPKRPDVYEAEYLAYYLTHAKKRDIVRLAQGSTIVHLYGRDIASLAVELPNLQTQQRAAATFAPARREIDLLAQLKRQYELQRRGLEQRLLTPPDTQRAAS